MNPAESTAAAVVVGIVLCAFAFSPAALAQRPGLARPTCPGGELPKCSCPPGTNVPYAGAHGCYDSEEFMYMKACKCDDGTDAQRPALLNLVGGAAGRRELQVMNQIFECADGGGLSSCSCAGGAVATARTNADQVSYGNATPNCDNGDPATCACPSADAVDIGIACLDSATRRILRRICTCDGQEVVARPRFRGRPE